MVLERILVLLLSSDRMKSIFETIDKSVYDFIIIDTPPVTRVVDTLALGQYYKECNISCATRYQYQGDSNWRNTGDEPCTN